MLFDIQGGGPCLRAHRAHTLQNGATWPSGLRVVPKVTVAQRQTLGCRRAPVAAEMLEQLDLNMAGVGR